MSRRLLCFLIFFPWLVLCCGATTRPMLWRGFGSSHPLTIIRAGWFKGIVDTYILSQQTQEEDYSPETAAPSTLLPSIELAIGAALTNSKGEWNGYETYSPTTISHYQQQIASLLQRAPNNLTVLAMQCHNSALFDTQQRGPLFTAWPDWSVSLYPESQVWHSLAGNSTATSANLGSSPDVPGSPPIPGAIPSLPGAIPSPYAPGAGTISPGYTVMRVDKPSGPLPSMTLPLVARRAVEAGLKVARKGQKLDPDNAFWDYKILQALYDLKRQSEFEQVLKGIIHKKRYHDYYQEEWQAFFAWKRYIGAPVDSSEYLPRWAFMESLTSLNFYHHPLQLWATQLVAGARLQKQNRRALDLGMGMVQLGRLRRLGAFTNEMSHQGIWWQQYSLLRARLDSLDKRGRTLTASKRPVAGGLNSYAPSLGALAQSLGDKRTAQWCSNQWDQTLRWRLPDPLSQFSAQSLTQLGLSLRIALTVGTSFWLIGFLLALCSRTGRGKPLPSIPVRSSLLYGALWATVGSLFNLGMVLTWADTNIFELSFFRLTESLPTYVIAWNIGTMVWLLFGAALTVRWRQWKRNRAAERELPFFRVMAWSFEQVHDIRPLIFFCVQGGLVVLIVGGAALALLLSLGQPWIQQNPASSLLGANLLIHTTDVAPILGWAEAGVALLTFALFLTVCFRPNARETRREMRVLLRDQTLGAFIAGSWIVMFSLLAWSWAEADIARHFAPFEKGQLVRISAQKVGLKWD